MNIGSLCSGIGGLELGLEWAGVGETVFQVEADPYCRRMLSKHWPKARLFDDVFKVGAQNLPQADLICFGFPCQDLSSAGKQAGLTGARSGLFYECARVVAELSPKWVVVENVASGAKLWVDACRGELERLGYATLPVPLAAGDCGALHRRARIFIVAHSVSARQASDAHGEPLRLDQQRKAARWKERSLRNERNAVSGFPGWGASEPDVVRMVHGVSDGLDAARVRALGNAVVPHAAQVIGCLLLQLIGE